MEISTYDKYLFIIKADGENFDIAELQTDNILNV